MMILYYNMEVLIRSMSFYILSNARLDQLEEAAFSLLTYFAWTRGIRRYNSASS